MHARRPSPGLITAMSARGAACAFRCPACGAALSARLSCEITAVACDRCGETFLTQHPDTLPSKPKKKKAAISHALLRAADDATSTAVIEHFKESAAFVRLSKTEMQDILGRDAEDGAKLAAGIAMAVEKGVLPANPAVEPTKQIDVLGKTAEDVSDAIIKALGKAASRGCVLVLQGLSGTGKGTTVAKLQAKLPRAASWSNGNVFRALTLLAVTYCEQRKVAFSASVLTPQLIAELMACLVRRRRAPPRRPASPALTRPRPRPLAALWQGGGPVGHPHQRPGDRHVRLPRGEHDAQGAARRAEHPDGGGAHAGRGGHVRRRVRVGHVVRGA